MEQRDDTGSSWLARLLWRASRPVSIWLLLLVGVAIMLAETDRLIAGTLTTAGHTHSLGDVLGPLAATHTGAWADWAAVDPPTTLIVVYAVLGLLFIAAYTVALWRLVHAAVVARRLLFALAVIDVTQSLLLIVTAFAPGVAPWLAGVVTVKWLTLLCFVIAVARNRQVKGTIVAFAVNISRAGYAQRLSAVALLPLAVLGLVPAADILDQLPDAERTWLDSPVTGVHGVLAVVLTFAVGACLFVLGRLRSQRVTAAFVRREPPKKDATFWWWCAGPLIAALAFAVLVVGERVTTGEVRFAFVDLRSFVVFLVLLLLPVAASLAIRGWIWIANRRRSRQRRDPVVLWSPGPRDGDPDRARYAVVTGDVLAGLVVAIGAFGLVRSFTAPLLLQYVVPGAQPAWKTVAFFALVAVGLVGGALSLHLLSAVVPRWVDPTRIAQLPEAAPGLASFTRRARAGTARALDATTRAESPSVTRRSVYLSFFIASSVVLAALTIFPREIAGALGIVATCLLAIGCWSAVVGIGIVQMQVRKPMEVFRLLRMRANPVLTLVVIVPLVITQLGNPAALHAVQVSGDALDLSEGRPDLESAFSTWLSRSNDCDRQIDVEGRDVTVRPLVVVAAAGGGIRAATWTTNAFAEIDRAGPCARSAVMLSSGTSGGSVGLSLFRGASPGDAGSVNTGVERLSYPDVLGGTVVGTFVGDNVAGLTGLRIPSRASLVDPEGGWKWQDRAALLESAWQDTAPQLATPYDLRFQHPTGWLILNSTDAGRKCRVLVSQIDLNTQKRDVPTICRTKTAELPASTDLIDVYRDCPFAMDWATAAMLSSRFPFVTPAGRVSSSTVAEGCDIDEMQLVDGGYFEASGLGTIADLAPALAKVVADHNARAASGSGPVVVPVVVFLDNSPGADVAENPPQLSAEITVPLVGRSAERLQVVPGTWIQRISTAFVNVCPEPGGAAAIDECAGAQRAVRSALPDGVVVVAPNTEPSIEAPLGWTLSQQSRSVLCVKLRDQMTPDVVDATRATVPYGTFAELLAVLEPDDPAYALDAAESVTPLCR